MTVYGVILALLEKSFERRHQNLFSFIVILKASILPFCFVVSWPGIHLLENSKNGISYQEFMYIENTCKDRSIYLETCSFLDSFSV